PGSPELALSLEEPGEVAGLPADTRVRVLAPEVARIECGGESLLLLGDPDLADSLSTLSEGELRASLVVAAARVTAGLTALIDRTPVQVPENQDVIRIFQYLGCLDKIGFHAGYYCWNATCNNCIFTYADPKTGNPVTIKACQTRVFEGMKVIHLPKDVQKK